MTQASYTVKHPRLYLRVNGKLQHVPQGTRLTLNEKQATALGRKIEAAKETEAVEIANPEETEEAPAPETPEEPTQDTESQQPSRRGRPPKSEAI